MSFYEILLIIISSAGLLHGFFLATYLLILDNKKSIANLLLAVVLIATGLRIGKSVVLNFVANLEFQYILLGLGLLLLIGPLLRWYTLAMTRSSYKLKPISSLALLPFCVVFFIRFFATEDTFKEAQYGLYIFGGLLLGCYFHLALHILLSWKILSQVKKEYPKENRTRAQDAIVNWLQKLLYVFVIIWISYMLNILDDEVPYIIGPILYSLGVYFLSYKGYQLKISSLDGSVFKNEDEQLGVYSKIVADIVKEKSYLTADITLASIGKKHGLTSQKTSAIINQYAKRNFNDFINSYRIEEAKNLLVNTEFYRYTISSIAYDVGFNSLSTFNTAFKKFEGITPSQYRKNNI